MGKTKTAILVALYRLAHFPSSKVLFLTPTKPLADQIRREFLEATTLLEQDVALFTGAIPPVKREELWRTAKVIVSTPQGCTNDMINERIALGEVSLLCFDECHRATGEYDYTFLAKEYMRQAKFPRIIGLTASPGSDVEGIRALCKNLYIEDIEIRTEDDPDVKPYIQELETQYRLVDLPQTFREGQQFLNAAVDERLKRLREMGYAHTEKQVGKGELLRIQRELQRRILQGEKDYALWGTVSLVAEVIKVQHALELFESQGVWAAKKYLDSLFESAEKTKVKATKRLAKDLNVRSAHIKIGALAERGEEHPKLEVLRRCVRESIQENPSAKMIIFTQYRDSATLLVDKLNQLEGIAAHIFVGQVKKKGTGISQKEQLRILQEFGQGNYNCLVSTSIGEEGLDIPKVDLVFFYEPIPSAIRTIQRSGRTARTEKGKVIVLVAKNTRDEAYRWVAHHKENQMYRVLSDLKTKLQLSPETQPSLKGYLATEVKVIADFRERNSGVIKALVESGVNVKLQQLAVSDYILSGRVGCEFKTKEDFVASLIDKRLLSQVKELKENFERPLLVLQGEEDLYAIRNVHPNAIRGMLATIAVSYGIPILQTKDAKDTAALLTAIARREQEAEKKDWGVRLERKPLTTKEQQEFIIESLPGIGPVAARALLTQLKSVKAVMNADCPTLKEVDLLGPKKAEEIRRIIEAEYPEEPHQEGTL